MKASLIGIGIAIVAGIFFCALSSNAQTSPSSGGTSCLSYPSGVNAPSGYSPSWDVFSSARELLVKTNCPTSGSNLTLTVGKNDTTQLVYNQSYIYNSAVTPPRWDSYTLDGTVSSGAWLTGVGTKQIQALASASQTSPMYMVGYVCTNRSGSWKCGCENTACTTGKWQLQAYKGLPSSATTGGTTGGNGGGTEKLSDSACLQRTANNILRGPNGNVNDEQFRNESPPSANYTYDFRNTTFLLDASVIYPVNINPSKDGLCIVGITAKGTQSRNLTWVDMKHDYGGDAVRVEGTGTSMLEGAWIDNVEDGFSPRGTTQWTVKDSYFRYIRDDVIENDSLLPGVVDDVLVDGTYILFSARPGADSTNGGAGSKVIFKVTDSLFKMERLPNKQDPKTAPYGPAFKDGKSHGQIFKMGAGGTVDMRNTIILMEGFSVNGPGSMEWPPGTYQNVTFVWLGEGNYPHPLPSGVTMTRDISAWNSARANWLSRHGCDASGDNCQFRNR